MSNYTLLKSTDHYDLLLIAGTQDSVETDSYAIRLRETGVIEAARSSYPSALLTLGQAEEAYSYAEENWMSDAKAKREAFQSGQFTHGI